MIPAPQTSLASTSRLPARLVLAVPALVVVAVVVLAAGCSGSPAPQAPVIPVQPPPPATATPPPAPAEAEALEEDQAQEPEDDPTLVVIHDPEVPRLTSLVEAARAERRRRAESEEAATRITNDNLSEWAQGQVTFVTEEDEAEDTDTTSGDASAAEEERGEDYWRNRMLELRLRLRRVTDEAVDLESRAADLRRRFYAEDDPYVRDGQIKRQWDHAQALLDQARQDAETYRRALEVALEEGRRDGALPGWLREGIELEPPAPEPADDEETLTGLPRHRSSPPETADDDGEP